MKWGSVCSHFNDAVCAVARKVLRAGSPWRERPRVWENLKRVLSMDGREDRGDPASAAHSPLEGALLLRAFSHLRVCGVASMVAVPYNHAGSGVALLFLKIDFRGRLRVSASIYAARSAMEGQWRADSIDPAKPGDRRQMGAGNERADANVQATRRSGGSGCVINAKLTPHQCTREHRYEEGRVYSSTIQ